MKLSLLLIAAAPLLLLCCVQSTEAWNPWTWFLDLFKNKSVTVDKVISKCDKKWYAFWETATDEFCKVFKDYKAANPQNENNQAEMEKQFTVTLSGNCAHAEKKLEANKAELEKEGTKLNFDPKADNLPELEHKFKEEGQGEKTVTSKLMRFGELAKHEINKLNKICAMLTEEAKKIGRDWHSKNSGNGTTPSPQSPQSPESPQSPQSPPQSQTGSTDNLIPK